MRAAAAAQGAPKAETAELCVLTEVGGVPLAVPTRAIDRLVAAADATLLPNRSEKALHPALLGTLQLDDERYAAWDLGSLLKLPSEELAWVLLRVELPDGELWLAFRLGRCSAVKKIPIDARLPPALFHRRGPAFTGAFALPEAHAELSPVGLVCEPAALLEEPELQLARLLLQEGHR